MTSPLPTSASPIEQLRYVRLGTRDLPAAVDFAERILGLELIGRTEQEAYFRSDYRDHTLVYVADDPAQRSIGLEVYDPETLARLGAALAARGLTVIEGDAEATARRKARNLLRVPMAGGYELDLVVRPLQSGWRYHGPRDAGITGLAGVALRGAADTSDHAIWTSVLGGMVSDWVGDAAYIRFADDAHHRIAVHPSATRGVLAVEYEVEDVDLIMQNNYYLRSMQVRIVDGPGRRPASNQMYITFAGPDDVLFSYVCEGAAVDGKRRPRQFPRARGSFCAWGSDTDIPEYQ